MSKMVSELKFMQSGNHEDWSIRLCNSRKKALEAYETVVIA